MNMLLERPTTALAHGLAQARVPLILAEDLPEEVRFPSTGWSEQGSWYLVAELGTDFTDLAFRPLVVTDHVQDVTSQGVVPSLQILLRYGDLIVSSGSTTQGAVYVVFRVVGESSGDLWVVPDFRFDCRDSLVSFGSLLQPPTNDTGRRSSRQFPLLLRVRKEKGGPVAVEARRQGSSVLRHGEVLARSGNGRLVVVVLTTERGRLWQLHAVGSETWTDGEALRSGVLKTAVLLEWTAEE